MKLGVLALQGAFVEHINALRTLDESLEVVHVKTVDDLFECKGLIIPGGESTTMSLVAKRSNLLESLVEFCNDPNKAVWGTCAGMILLAKSATQSKKGGQDLFGGMNITVNRNQYGSQVESFQQDIHFDCLHDNHIPFNGIFIRAPILHSFDENCGIEILAKLNSNPVDKAIAPMGDVVALRQGNKMATSFHPELTKDYRLHDYFLNQIVKKI